MTLASAKTGENTPVVIYGSGAVAHYVFDICLSLNQEIRGVIDGNRKKGERLYGVEVIGDEYLLNDSHLRATTRLVIAVGNVTQRRKVFEESRRSGYALASLIHPSCMISPYAEIGEGAIINPFTSIRIGAKLGNLFLCEGHSRVGYENRLGDNVIVATNVMLNAKVGIGDDCFFGTSATLLPYLKVGNACYIAAGALVTKNIPNGRLAIGSPANFAQVSPIISDPQASPSRRSSNMTT